LFQPIPFERQPAGEDLDRSAGFTLIEILVTLAVAAICLAAIGSLMAGNLRGSGRIAQHIALVETMRAVETGLPNRASLATAYSPVIWMAKLGPSISDRFRAMRSIRARPKSGRLKRFS